MQAKIAGASIYAIVDENNACRYVGMSRNPERRWIEHTHRAAYSYFPLYRWLKRHEGARLIILEQVPDVFSTRDPYPLEREARWIRYMRKKFDLFNFHPRPSVWDRERGYLIGAGSNRGRRIIASRASGRATPDDTKGQ